jgi:hypothetical protein
LDIRFFISPALVGVIVFLPAPPKKIESRKWCFLLSWVKVYLA